MIAQGQQQWQQLAQRMVEEVGRLWQGLEGMETGGAVETAVQAWVWGVGREVMVALCQEAIRRREQQQAPQCCGARMDHHSRRWRTVKTLVGDVRVRRRYYRCGRCDRALFPADGWLGWGGDFSHGVQEAAAWECSLLPYRQAVASLSKLAGIELSVKGAQAIAGSWGEVELAPAPYGEGVDKELVIQIDGTKAHLQEGWREVKVAACFSWDRSDPEAQPETVTYTADWETAEQFRQTLWQEALARGAPTARSQAVIGDGAPWVWEMASYLFPHATQILDWYHLTEHLWEAAKLVHGEGADETAALEKRWEREIWQGRSEGVEDHLRELVSMGKDDTHNTLRKCADYLQTHQHRLRYHLFCEAGWPVGSGVVEGACKHLIGLRFKRQSTRWSKAGARAVLHLALDRTNHRWDARCHRMRTP